MPTSPGLFGSGKVRLPFATRAPKISSTSSSNGYFFSTRSLKASESSGLLPAALFLAFFGGRGAGLVYTLRTSYFFG
ncbi:hypothetical protein ABTD35_19380, partial [Acinetobacter baumannii]